MGPPGPVTGLKKKNIYIYIYTHIILQHVTFHSSPNYTSYSPLYPVPSIVTFNIVQLLAAFLQKFISIKNIFNSTEFNSFLLMCRIISQINNNNNNNNNNKHISGRNYITCSTNSKYRRNAREYTPKHGCFRYIILNILHKCDNKDNNNNNTVINFITPCIYVMM
jgi:hypothetical protein